MSLQQRLDRIREGFVKQAPAEAIAIMHRFTEELRASSLLQDCVKEGQQAPAFELQGSDSAATSLESFLKRGPLVLTFFRGHW